MKDKTSYKDKKVISIGVISELTGLSERQIRYYEERKLIFPERTNGGTRKYSFSDVEALVDIANKMEDGVQTYEIRQEKIREKKKIDKEKIRKQMLKGQINAQFGVQK
ncbi:MerR family transcriptional regulator [Niallia oryzisoli]|uniref:MerR family transcriptional regulator n=1 Tax=Niallia oryzisoli TaxID=1737571 RepID=A0ABZ2CN13_9BACI